MQCQTISSLDQEPYVYHFLSSQSVSSIGLYYYSGVIVEVRAKSGTIPSPLVINVNTIGLGSSSSTASSEHYLRSHEQGMKGRLYLLRIVTTTITHYVQYLIDWSMADSRNKGYRFTAWTVQLICRRIIYLSTIFRFV